MGIMSRNKEIWGADGLIESYEVDVTWDHVRGVRGDWLNRTDGWFVSDRWALLSDEEQEQLLIFRQALRNITDHPDPNTAADAMPHAEGWFLDA